MVDYAFLITSALTTASVVILGGLLFRYRQLIRHSEISTSLAKDLWDSVNSRFGVVDARIIDLMAKTEVLSTRLGPGVTAAGREIGPRSVSVPVASKPAETPVKPVITVMQKPSPLVGTETERRVLGLLAQGPKTSAQIKEDVGRSREHIARLMKGLFDRGLVVRNDRNKPYVYEITESGRVYLAS